MQTMKNLQAPFLGALLLLAAIGCRKNDLNDKPSPDLSEVSTAGNSVLKKSDWVSQSNWTKVEQPSYTVFYTNIKTDDVTSDVADNGLIRVFKSGNENNPISLPFEETAGSQKLYWYYQVTKGNIMIAVDVYGNGSNPTQSQLFKNVVLDKKAIESFESKGTSKVELMNLSYDKLMEAGK
jgi:hypothetical protein